MMPKWIRASVFVLAAASPVTVAPTASVRQVDHSRALTQLDQRLEHLRRRANIPGMTAAVAAGGDVIWTKGFGQSDVAARRPATPDTVYHLASLTKPFAAAVLLQLVDEGRLSLETPASNFGIDLPESPLVLHLLTHTSAGEPGDRYAYDGNRFSQLDKVVTSITGRSFAQVVGERILAPLALNDTAANPLLAAACVESGRDPETFLRRLAQGYDPEGKAPVAYRARFSTAAGLVATARDMARFSIAWDGYRVLPESLTLRAVTPMRSRAGRTLPYGLGWFVQSRPRRLIWHYGYWVGASSLIVKMPDSGLTFVLLANSDGLSRKYDLGRDDNVLRSPFARAFADAFPR